MRDEAHAKKLGEQWAKLGEKERQNREQELKNWMADEKNKELAAKFGNLSKAQLWELKQAQALHAEKAADQAKEEQTKKQAEKEALEQRLVTVIHEANQQKMAMHEARYNIMQLEKI